MTGLEQTFLIMAIIFMGLMFLMLIALVIAVFAIRAKINKIHDNIESKIDVLTNLAGKGGELAGLATEAVVKTAKKAVRRSKR